MNFLTSFMRFKRTFFVGFVSLLTVTAVGFEVSSLNVYSQPGQTFSGAFVLSNLTDAERANMRIGTGSKEDYIRFNETYPADVNVNAFNYTALSFDEKSNAVRYALTHDDIIDRKTFVLLVKVYFPQSDTSYLFKYNFLPTQEITPQGYQLNTAIPTAPTPERIEEITEVVSIAPKRLSMQTKTGDTLYNISKAIKAVYYPYDDSMTTSDIQNAIKATNPSSFNNGYLLAGKTLDLSFVETGIDAADTHSTAPKLPPVQTPAKEEEIVVVEEQAPIKEESNATALDVADDEEIVVVEKSASIKEDNNSAALDVADDEIEDLLDYDLEAVEGDTLTNLSETIKAVFYPLEKDVTVQDIKQRMIEVNPNGFYRGIVVPQSKIVLPASF